MAFVVKYTYDRPNTDVEFPRVSDYDSDFDTTRRQGYTDNSINLDFDLSGDELTLVSTLTAPDEAAWNSYRSSVESGSEYTAIENSIQSDLTARGISANYTTKDGDDAEVTVWSN